MIAGATAVQVGTANFVDPFIWSKLLDGMRDYMQRHQHRACSRPRRHDRHQHHGRSSGSAPSRARRRHGAARARSWPTSLSGVVGGFKVGSRLFTLEGPALVRALAERGARVFLDLKFHDIPNTVAQAVEAAAQTGAWMINVHASGGVPMMQAAAKARADAAAQARPAEAAASSASPCSPAWTSPRCTRSACTRPLMEQVVDAGAHGAAGRPRRRRRLAARDARDSRRLRPRLRRGHARHPRRRGGRRQERSDAHDGAGRGHQGRCDLYRRRAADHRGARSARRGGSDRRRGTAGAGGL